LLLLYIATGEESNDFFIGINLSRFLFIYVKELKNGGFKKYDFKEKFIEVILNPVNQDKRFI
jgi:hypothetical protein